MLQTIYQHCGCATGRRLKRKSATKLTCVKEDMAGDWRSWPARVFGGLKGAKVHGSMRTDACCAFTASVEDRRRSHVVCSSRCLSASHEKRTVQATGHILPPILLDASCMFLLLPPCSALWPQHWLQWAPCPGVSSNGKPDAPPPFGRHSAVSGRAALSQESVSQAGFSLHCTLFDAGLGR
eukprot:6176234-Pleurochrysis_carterae.AAC.3